MDTLFEQIVNARRDTDAFRQALTRYLLTHGKSLTTKYTDLSIEAQSEIAQQAVWAVRKNLA